MDVDATSTEDGPTLVMAMPRRELWAVSGLERQVQLEVLESIEHESWFATREAIAGDVETKEVRIGLVLHREDQVLVHEDGVILHACAVPPEVERLAPGLRGLREFARLAARRLLGTQEEDLRLLGYLNEDRLEEAAGFLFLVYTVQVAPGCAAPLQTSWVGTARLGDLTLDPLSALFRDEFVA
ncbi:MAG: hypothetical protein ACOCYP_00915 [Planctomycetota bacterium]